MARYRKVDPRIWNDARFIALCDRGKLAFLFVLTHPHMTALGAMRATTSGLAAELGWSPKQFDEAINSAVETGMVEINRGASYIGLPRFLRYNEPEGPNSVSKAWLEAIGMIPECPEKHILAARCRQYLDERSQKFRESLPSEIWEAFDVPSRMPSDMPSDIPCRIQEQEQEQEQEQDLYIKGGSKDRPSDEDFEAFWQAYPTRDGRRVGKTKSAEAFNRLDVSEIPDVMRAVRNYAGSERVKDGYARDPIRFLQGGFWRDWLADPAQEKPAADQGEPKRLCFQ